jgi:hypothetical protein
MNRTAIKLLTAGAATFSVGALLATGNAAAEVPSGAPHADVDRSWQPVAQTHAVPTKGHEAMRLVKEYSEFAGSYKNATSLVLGLRTGSPVTLSDHGGSSGGSTTGGIVQFQPPDHVMGWGNVRHALSLARAELAAQGIDNPTPAQIETALMGGTVLTASGSAALPGILTLRSQGMGWGQISHRLGVTPNSRFIPVAPTPPFLHRPPHGQIITAAGERAGAMAHSHRFTDADDATPRNPSPRPGPVVTHASTGAVIQAGLTPSGTLAPASLQGVTHAAGPAFSSHPGNSARH